MFRAVYRVVANGSLTTQLIRPVASNTPGNQINHEIANVSAKKDHIGDVPFAFSLVVVDEFVKLHLNLQQC